MGLVHRNLCWFMGHSVKVNSHLSAGPLSDALGHGREGALSLRLKEGVTHSHPVSVQREKSWQERQRVLATHPRSLSAVGR